MAKGDCLDVVFRVFPEGDVVALFPGVKEGVGTIMSYQHVGQHAAASSTLSRVLRAATPMEYAPLLAELKRIGYCLRVMKRAQIPHSTKKRPSQERVVSRHGLGTADVRTGEGAYWIITAPTGYRVDYKPWGPSSEVDLGTFSSRRQARAKITAHAGSVGATIVS